MDRQEETKTTLNPQTDHELGQRSWITPSFDRVELKDALSGNTNFNIADVDTLYS